MRRTDKQNRKLELKKETLRRLSAVSGDHLRLVAGGDRGVGASGTANCSTQGPPVSLDCNPG
jgi:hypothetical protein